MTARFVTVRCNGLCRMPNGRSLAIAFALGLTREAKKENGKPAGDSEEAQAFAERRIRDPRHAGRKEGQASERHQPMPEAVRPQHRRFAVRKTSRRSPIRRDVPIEMMALFGRHNLLQ